ncbi:testis-specific serine/threonine-protein kinase 1 [Fopius arisanus]|uniref:Testis-specific serine/threonine-protein kinase 1 n=1 Tax=Fopius arisanus TaxID=64838 RepID=A0A9R1SYD3_9HYME|nr:PREDICTED: testis-specific serine/threonine-protein kinase 1-like [Fopius arisanus]
MSQVELNQTPSEELTLRSRGYKLLRKLGEGSFAKVFLAEYTPENEPEQISPLACKIVDTSKAPKDFVKKFLPRELDILAKLNHPHVVHVHSIFQRRCRYFIFMRFAENGDLLDFTLKNGAVDEDQARVWFRQLALGLQYLHEMEIAHRDIKCENVLLTANNNVKLTDFGFARYVIDPRGKKVLSDTFCGSLMYAAPEILRGAPYNPKAADTWSLGVILYIILNKAMPFDEPNLKKLYEIQMNRKWKFRKKVADSLSEQVKKLVMNLLEPEVAKRWSVDQIIHSSWIAMDPRLVVMTPAEQAALNNAIEERKKNEEKLRKQSLYRDDHHPQRRESRGEDSKGEDVKVLADSGKKTLSTSAIDNRNLPRASGLNRLGSISE